MKQMKKKRFCIYFPFRQNHFYVTMLFCQKEKEDKKKKYQKKHHHHPQKSIGPSTYMNPQKSSLTVELRDEIKFGKSLNVELS